MSDESTAPAPSVAPKSKPAPPAPAAEAKSVEVWRVELETPDEQYRPASLYHRWPRGLVLSQADYLAQIDVAMNASFSSPKA
jgi:hypothetical protein